MNIIYHQGLTSTDWFSKNIFEQMANIGSEIFRTISWREKKPDFSQKAFFRGLELLDLTAEDPNNCDRLTEILRTREALVDYFVYDNEYKSSDKLWQDYFYAYNYAARVAI